MAAEAGTNDRNGEEALSAEHKHTDQQAKLSITTGDGE